MAPVRLSTAIAIAAPPGTVRYKFLDFPSIPLYHRSSSLIKSLTPPVGKTGLDLSPGDPIKHEIRNGITFTPTVLQNNETSFSWEGYWPFSWFSIFSGVKSFQFLPAANGGTHFVQEEKFTGLLALVMSLSFARKQTTTIFSEFNEDLKRWCEMDRE